MIILPPVELIQFITITLGSTAGSGFDTNGPTLAAALDEVAQVYPDLMRNYSLVAKHWPDVEAPCDSRAVPYVVDSLVEFYSRGVFSRGEPVVALVPGTVFYTNTREYQPKPTIYLNSRRALISHNCCSLIDGKESNGKYSST